MPRMFIVQDNLMLQLQDSSLNRTISCCSCKTVHCTGQSHAVAARQFTVQDNQMYCKEQSHASYRTITCIVQDNHMIYTGQSLVLYRTILCIIQDNYMNYTGQSHILYRTITWITQDNHMYCTGQSHAL